MASDGLTDYERRRLDNIRRNEDMMSSLLIHRKVSDLAAAASAKRPQPHPSTPSKRPKPASSPVVIRRSLRARGIPPGSSPDTPPLSSPSPPSPPPPRQRGLIGIHDAYVGTPSADRGLLDAVLDMADRVPLTARKKLVLGDGDGWDPKRSMTLKPENVMRFLPGRIMCVVFFPFMDRTLIAAGDKNGHVGFWDVDRPDGEGKYLYAPHSSPVSSIVMQPLNVEKLYTSSYDGLIRLMDVENETFNVVYTSDDAIYSACQQPGGTHSLCFGEGNGWLNFWDERAGKLSGSWVLHDTRINTIDFSSKNTNLMATSSSDGTVCLWDLRRLKQEKSRLKVIQHDKAVHSAIFSPSGSTLATTSLDNHVRILSGDDFSDIVKIHHDNRTGRWISTFRAIWGWDDTFLFIGNMKRAVDVISSSSRTTVSLVSEYMTAIPSRFAAHPLKKGHLACSTAGGQVYLWTS